MKGIHDFFIIFTGNYKQFDKLMEHRKSVHETIKFDILDRNKEENSCTFLLDIEIML